VDFLSRGTETIVNKTDPKIKDTRAGERVGRAFINAEVAEITQRPLRNLSDFCVTPAKTSGFLRVLGDLCVNLLYICPNAGAGKMERRANALHPEAIQVFNEFS
jgi:hypothetical protein